MILTPVYWVSSALIFITALFVYLRNPKGKTNIVFLFFSLIVGSWILSASFLFIYGTIFLSNLTTFLGFLMGSAFPVFIRYFPKSKESFINKTNIFLLFYTLTAFVLIYMRLIIKDVRTVDGQLEPVLGVGYPPFVLTALLLSAYGFYLTVKKYRSSIGVEREQLRYFFLGLTIFFLSSIFSNVIAPLVNLNFLTAVGPAASVIFVGSIAYSVIGKRLLDVRLVVARTVAYFLLISTIVIVYVVSSISLGSLFLEKSATKEQVIFYALLTLLITLTFQPIKQFFENLTDKIFFKGKYDSQELISGLTNIMATTLGIKPLASGTLTRLVEEMRITRGALIIAKGSEIEDMETEGYDKEPKFQMNDLMEIHDGKILVLDELAEGSTKELLRKLNISIAVPLEVGKDKLGYLLLGEKSSGEIYTSQDIDVLEVFAPELSIALENAKSYEEIKKFNVTLEDNVNKATAELLTANDRLKNLDKAKDEFISVVSHELRTPMTAIKSYVWLMLNRPAGPAKMKNYLFKVYDSSERLIGMINDVLDVSHIETGRLNVDIQPISAVKIAEDAIDTMKANATERKVALVVENSAAVPLVSADAQKLSEIYVNLIGNSLKFTKPDGKITVSFEKKADSVEISVADTGIGISKEDLPKLFTKFSRLQRSYATMATTGGSGLGLYITKNYVELMGGKIWVNSTLGKGTIFTFTLPVSTSQKAAETEALSITPHIIRNPNKK